MKQTDLPFVARDITKNFHEGVSTSEAAFNANAPQLGKLKRLVLDFIIGAGERGATIDEATIGLNRTWQSVGARISELVADGLIVRLAAKRDTSRGNPSHVHVTPGAWESLGRPERYDRRGSRRRHE